MAIKTFDRYNIVCLDSQVGDILMHLVEISRRRQWERFPNPNAKPHLEEEQAAWHFTLKAIRR